MNSDFVFKVDDNQQLKPIKRYEDLGFPSALVRNIRNTGYGEITKIQEAVLQCMSNNICAVGNIPTDLGAEVAYIAYSITACLKAKGNGSYKSENYRPYAIFILKDEAMMQKFHGIAEKLAEDLEVSTVLCPDDRSEVDSELALQECDLVFITSTGFHKYIEAELILFKDLKIVVAQDLNWEDDKIKISQYKDMMEDDDFPQPGERLLIFFDPDFSTVANDVMVEDQKGYILLGGAGPAGDVNPKLWNYLAPDVDFDEGAAPTEEVFEMCTSVKEKDDAFIKHMKELYETHGSEEFPKTMIFVKSTFSGRHVIPLFHNFPLYTPFADGNAKRVANQATVERFIGCPFGVMLATNLQRLEEGVKYKIDGLKHVIFYDAPDIYSYKIDSQLEASEGFRPKKIITFVGGADYPLVKKILDDHVKNGKPLDDKYQEMATQLKVIFDTLPDDSD